MELDASLGFKVWSFYFIAHQRTASWTSSRAIAEPSAFARRPAYGC